MTVRHLVRDIAGALIVASAMLVLPASANAGQVVAHVYVGVAPPHHAVERRLVAPGHGYVWVPGYYVHDGRAYVWTAGRWMLPPRPRAVWVAPRWQHERRGWFVVAGHWR